MSSKPAIFLLLSITYLVGLNNSLSAQGIYQNSVQEGLSLGPRLSYLLWDADVLTTERLQLITYGLDLSYGLSERLGISGSFTTGTHKVSDHKELFFQFNTEELVNQTYHIGAMYDLGSTKSIWRYGIKGGFNYQRSRLELKSGLDQSQPSIDFKGWGGFASIYAQYFLRSFLSIGSDVSYTIGRYNQSEYIGFRYKEELNYSNLAFALSIRYHFLGR